MILFDEVIFGPVLSRRLGTSLGINLSTINSKVCNFNCIYCECGWTESVILKKEDIPSALEFEELLEQKLIKLITLKSKIDSITFAGNGEPTIHPEFPEIIDRTIKLRDKYYPKTKITVLSNASTVKNENIINSLMKVDNNMLKLDAGTDKTFCLINKPQFKISLDEIVNDLKRFNGKLNIQSLFVKGDYNGIPIDNTTEEEVKAWLNRLSDINPALVVIYPISREPAHKDVIKISKSVLDDIAKRVVEMGIKAEVYY